MTAYKSAMTREQHMALGRFKGFSHRYETALVYKANLDSHLSRQARSRRLRSWLRSNRVKFRGEAITTEPLVHDSLVLQTHSR